MCGTRDGAGLGGDCRPFFPGDGKVSAAVSCEGDRGVPTLP